MKEKEDCPVLGEDDDINWDENCGEPSCFDDPYEHQSENVR